MSLLLLKELIIIFLLDMTDFDHFVPVGRICVVMSSRQIAAVSPPDVTNQIQFQGMSHINLSTAHYDINFIDRDKMIQACDIEDARKQNQTVNYTEKKHFIKQLPIVQVLHVFFSAPSVIICNFASYEG